MSLACTPAVARAVAGRLSSAFDGVDGAATSLFTAAATLRTTNLTFGMGTLTSEAVEEIGLVVSVLRNLAASIESADAFSGAGEHFGGKADEALALLLGSLSDGRGDYGGGSAESRVDRLTDDIWPDGVPSGLSDEKFVNMILTDPRASTLTPAELAAIWPELPEAGRVQFSDDEPVTVLDLVVDGGLVLSDEELDTATQSIVSSPPTLDVEVDPALQDRLDAASGGDLVPDPTGTAIERADILIAAGEAGRDYRDATNHPITYLSLVAALQAGGTASRNVDGLIVVVVPDGATISLNDLTEGSRGGVFDNEFPPFAKGGTTYGNTFIVPARDDGNPPGGELLGHENIHTYQWAAAGPVQYAALYLAESAKSGAQDVAENGLDVDYATVDVGPVGPDSIGGWHIPGTPWTTIEVDIPQFDPPPIRIPTSVASPDTGCGNRFEEHAGHSEGGYSCEP